MAGHGHLMDSFAPVNSNIIISDWKRQGGRSPGCTPRQSPAEKHREKTRAAMVFLSGRHGSACVFGRALAVQGCSVHVPRARLLSQHPLYRSGFVHTPTQPRQQLHVRSAHDNRQADFPMAHSQAAAFPHFSHRQLHTEHGQLLCCLQPTSCLHGTSLQGPRGKAFFQPCTA
jgi:hypothetical protein